MKKLFIGFEKIKINGNSHESLDKKIFVESTSTKKNQTQFFKIDNFKSKKELESSLLSFLNKTKIDLIIFNLINDEICQTTLLKLKNSYKTINWFGDDQWRFESFSRYKCWLFEYCITTDQEALEKYKNIGYKNIILSQWGAVQIKKNKIQNYNFDITFIGSYSIAREWLILKLRKNKLDVKVFGSGWDKNTFLTFRDFENIISSSRINLNLSNSAPRGLDMIWFFLGYLINRPNKGNLIKLLKAIKLKFFYKKNVEQVKARNFEILAMNGFQLTNRVPQLKSYFKENKHLVYFDNDIDIIDKCKFYLEHEHEREKIRERGFIESHKHTYKKRFEEIFKKLDNLNLRESN